MDLSSLLVNVGLILITIGGLFYSGGSGWSRLLIIIGIVFVALSYFLLRYFYGECIKVLIQADAVIKNLQMIIERERQKRVREIFGDGNQRKTEDQGNQEKPK